jgi:outer membrane lipoprotein-sorting protein
MKLPKSLLLLLFFSLLSSLSFTTQTQSPNSILNGVYKKMMKAKDYSVQATIKVDLPFIKMKPVEAQIYFKQKDKFRVISKGIAIIPRQGFDQLTKMLKDTTSFTAVNSGSETIGNALTSIISVIPSADTSDLILGKLWIDNKQNLVLKSQLTTKSNGTILTEYTYGTQVGFGLPDNMVFTVDVKKFKVPKSVAADINNSKKADPKADKKKGKIYIKLYNYQVNKGISDDVFKK